MWAYHFQEYESTAQEIFRIHIHHFNQSYSDNKYLINDRMSSSHRRIYTRQVFQPGVEYAYVPQAVNTYNMWHGWVHPFEKYFKVDEKCISLILYHLRDVICSGNLNLYHYILKLWKLILLGHKTGINQVFTSREQGSGKKIMSEYFGKKYLANHILPTSVVWKTWHQNLVPCAAARVLSWGMNWTPGHQTTRLPRNWNVWLQAQLPS